MSLDRLSAGQLRADTRRWWALGALALSVLVVGLDLSVLNLALPTLPADLHASTGDLQWFVDAYSLVLAAALLPAGLLGDRLGRKKLLGWRPGAVRRGVAGLRLLPDSAGELIAARAVLGLAAAVILPLSLAVLPVLFTAGGAAAGHRRGRRRHVPRLPDRPAARRLAARPLLVGLGIPDQRPGRRHRADRRRVPDAGVPQRSAAPGSTCAGVLHLQRRPGRAHLRRHQGRAERMGRRGRASPPWRPGLVALAAFVGLGDAASPAARRRSRWST